MQRTEPTLVAVAVLLAAFAGFVDALAFTSLGGFFASFMSGNSTRLGVALHGGAWNDARLAGAMLLSFISGVVLATAIARARPGRFLVPLTGAIAALLAAAAIVAELQSGPLALQLLAIGSGAAHVLVRRQSRGGTSLTDALTRFGEGVAEALMGVKEGPGWLVPLLLWAGFVAGVVLGAGAFLAIGLRALWVAASAAATVTLWSAVRQRPPALMRS
jgi:uncharacterized membrane protein YoaK (UPF0700 family)